jgi:hypothetical protein
VERSGQPDQPIIGPRPQLPAGHRQRAGPNKAGQPGCSLLLRERQDGPWLLFLAALTESAVIWDGVSGVRYGTDSPTGDVDDSPNATLQADGTLTLNDR